MSSKYEMAKLQIRYYGLRYGYVGNGMVNKKALGIERYSESGKEKNKWVSYGIKKVKPQYGIIELRYGYIGNGTVNRNEK